MLTYGHAARIQQMAIRLQQFAERAEDSSVVQDLLLNAKSKLDSAAARILYPQDYKE
jgi:hypothetical protein